MHVQDLKIKLEEMHEAVERDSHTDFFNLLHDYIDEKGVIFKMTGGEKNKYYGHQNNDDILIVISQPRTKMFQEVLLPQLHQMAQNHGFKLKWEKKHRADYIIKLTKKIYYISSGSLKKCLMK